MLPKYIELNNEILDENGNIRSLEKDKESARAYFLENVNKKTMFFYSLKEKLDYLVENEYYEKEFLEKYDFKEIKKIFKLIYDKKFRFPSYMSAFKFYNDYALRTREDDYVYLERYEDRLAIIALYYGEGDFEKAKRLAISLINQDFTPATPTLLNTGRKKGGEKVSCFLEEIEDSLNSISRTLEIGMQLSKRGGGCAFFLSNLRAKGESLRGNPIVSKGVVSVAKLFDNAFRYADQAGQRNGAAAVYLSVFHSDIEDFLSSKKINADDDIRLKTLSIGVTIPDLFMEKAKKDEDYYVFYPHTVYQAYGIDFGTISTEIDKWYDKLVENPNVRKRKLNARKILQNIAILQGEAGYPFIAFTDNINRQSANSELIKFSNLCVTGDSLLLTDNGYRRADELYQEQEELKVVIDKRTKNLIVNDFGVEVVNADKMYLTKKSAEIFKLVTSKGYELRSTEWHKYYVERSGKIEKLQLNQLNIGDNILLQSKEGTYGKNNDVELAYLMGVITGDGCLYKSPNRKNAYFARISLHQDKIVYRECIEKYVHSVIERYKEEYKHNAKLNPTFVEKKNLREKTFYEIQSGVLGKILKTKFNFHYDTKLRVPKYVFSGTKEVQCAYLSGLFQMDGYLSGVNCAQIISLSSVSLELIKDIQIMLLNMGIVSNYNIRKRDFNLLPDSKGNNRLYAVKDLITLFISGESRDIFMENITLKHNDLDKYKKYLESPNRRKGNIRKFTDTIKSIVFDGIEDVYDTTQPDYHSLIFNGIVTGNCTEILQYTKPTKYAPYDRSEDDEVGMGISCNLASGNIVKMMEHKTIKETVYSAMDIMNTVSDESNLTFAKGIYNANKTRRSVGLGMMNLHAYLAKNYILYGSEESIEFVDVFFNMVNYYSLRYSMERARDTGKIYSGFESSKYADGTYFDNRGAILPKSDKVIKLFKGIDIPSQEEWDKLKIDVMNYGLYNSERLAIAPTGSISYVMSASASVSPIRQLVEERTYGNSKTYFPMPFVDTHGFMYQTAYEMDNRKIMNVIATIQKHIDQGISLEMCERSYGTTRDLIKNIIYAHHIGLKTLYYTRTQKLSIQECLSCAV